MTGTLLGAGLLLRSALVNLQGGYLGCSLYVAKPVEYENFTEAIRRLGLFLQVVKAPEQRAA